AGSRRGEERGWSSHRPSRGGCVEPRLRRDAGPLRDRLPHRSRPRAAAVPRRGARVSAGLAVGAGTTGIPALVVGAGGRLIGGGGGRAVMAVDAGTTGITALVVGADGRLLGRGYRELQQHFPKPGEVEHDPDEIFRAVLEAGREAIRQGHVVPAGIGLTNQRE